MIRAILAVACAIALVAASLPAIDDVRTERAEAALETEIDRFDRAAAVAADADHPRAGGPGAQRAVRIDLPVAGLLTADADWIVLGADSGRLVRYRVAGGTERTATLSVPVRTADGSPVNCSAAGSHRIILRPAPEGDGVVGTIDGSCGQGFK